MHMVKLLFQILQIKPFLAPGKLETTDKAHPGSWENSRPPGALLRVTAWRQVEASRPLCLRERPRPTDDR